ncbi:MAG: 2-C-methyl-D-erythritol 2,4-cyclodiphosphate synthase [Candidatus Limnocylindria bacterium]
MRSRIAETLGVPAGSVSVKATTNDGVGVIGAGDAIAAFATAVLVERG